jgi:2-polyprenyl-3-methyl-5-hydroxy-6-metoxy-1,4-benzoquinol methylase
MMVTTCPVCGHRDFRHLHTCKDYTVSGQSFAVVLCQHCGTALTQNAPGPDQIGPYYQSEDYISHSDTKAGLFNGLYHAARRIMLRQKRELVQRVVGRKAGNLLDVGCGTGYFLATMQRAGWQATGVEADAGARAYAHQKFGLQVLAPEALATLPEGEYQAVTLWHVMEHLHDLDGYLRQMARVLHPNGALVIAVPNHQSTDAQHYGADWAGWDVPRHLWHFSPKSMEILLAKYEFSLMDKRTMPFDPFYVSLLSEKYRQSSLAPVRGAWQGLRSLVAGLAQVDQSSSVIYVFLRT